MTPFFPVKVVDPSSAEILKTIVVSDKANTIDSESFGVRLTYRRTSIPFLLDGRAATFVFKKEIGRVVDAVNEFFTVE